MTLVDRYKMLMCFDKDLFPLVVEIGARDDVFEILKLRTLLSRTFPNAGGHVS